MGLGGFGGCCVVGNFSKRNTGKSNHTKARNVDDEPVTFGEFRMADAFLKMGSSILFKQKLARGMHL